MPVDRGRCIDARKDKRVCSLVRFSQLRSMATTKKTPAYWPDACRALGRRDAVLQSLITEYPDVTLRSRGSAFETLLRAIVGQQISVKAAAAIWGRFEQVVESVTPEDMLESDVELLRGCGLSKQKISYMFDLAEHFVDGRLNARRFRGLDDEELIAALSHVKGIGRWTAEMFLIFHLHRPDVYPLQDIGLIRAVERHYLNGERIERAQLIEIGERWRPWRSVATWYLWRSLDPFPVEY